MKDCVGPMVSGWLKRARQEALLVVLAAAAGGIAGVLTAVFGRGVLAVTALAGSAALAAGAAARRRRGDLAGIRPLGQGVQPGHGPGL